MQLAVSAILLLIYGLCAYKIILWLIDLVRHHKQQRLKVYFICFLAAVPILFGLLAVLYAANETLFGGFGSVTVSVLGLASIVTGVTLITTILLSSSIAPKGALKKIAFTFFWLFFVLWNVGLWAVVTYSRRALRARIRAVYPSDGSYSYRYEPYYYDTTTSRMIVVPPELLNQTQDQPRQVSPDGME